MKKFKRQLNLKLVAQTKTLLLIFTLAQAATICHAQGHSGECSDRSLHKKPLLVKKNIKVGTKRIKGVFLALNYDFNDSISICFGKKEVFTALLNYKMPDSNTNVFPFNRRLIRIDSLFRKNATKDKCRIIFWQSKCYIDFVLKRKLSFYNLGLANNQTNWTLDLMNVYPWPD